MVFKRSDLEFQEVETEATSLGRVYLTPAGAFPSVTTVLSAKEADGHDFLKEWRDRVGEAEANRISSEATRRGTKFHETVEKYLKNQEIGNLDMLTKSHFMQVKKWLTDNVDEVLGNEIPLYSKLLKVAGRCDCIAVINGKLYMVDFKTSKHAKSTADIAGYRLQCSAYMYMAKEMFGLEFDGFCILISNLFENHPTIFYGDKADYKNNLRQFLEVRNKWMRLYGNTLETLSLGGTSSSILTP